MLTPSYHFQFPDTYDKITQDPLVNRGGTQIYVNQIRLVFLYVMMDRRILLMLLSMFQYKIRVSNKDPVFRSLNHCCCCSWQCFSPLVSRNENEIPMRCVLNALCPSIQEHCLNYNIKYWLFWDLFLLNNNKVGMRKNIQCLFKFLTFSFLCSICTICHCKRRLFCIKLCSHNWSPDILFIFFLF